jgi:hypothetical protein
MLTDFLLQVFVLIFWVAGFYWIYRVCILLNPLRGDDT